MRIMLNCCYKELLPRSPHRLGAVYNAAFDLIDVPSRLHAFYYVRPQVLQRFEALPGASDCAVYQFVDQRGGWELEAFHLEQRQLQASSGQFASLTYAEKQHRRVVLDNLPDHLSHAKLRQRLLDRDRLRDLELNLRRAAFAWPIKLVRAFVKWCNVVCAPMHVLPCATAMMPNIATGHGIK